MDTQPKSWLPQEVLNTLGRLASEPYQRRWIVDATKFEYVVPSELIGAVETVAKWAATANTMPWILAATHRFLTRFYECLAVMPKDIDVEKDSAWIDLRKAAANALAELGHPVPDDIPE